MTCNLVVGFHSIHKRSGLAAKLTLKLLAHVKRLDYRNRLEHTFNHLQYIVSIIRARYMGGMEGDELI